MSENFAYDARYVREKYVEKKIPPTFIQDLTEDGRHMTRFQKAEMSFIIMNVPNTAAAYRRMCYGPKKFHIIISRKWNITFHVMLWTKTDNKQKFGPYFFDGLVNQLWAGKRGRYNDWLRAGRSGDRIPVGARISAPNQPPVQWVLGLS
jgi:hypothetical protein